MKHLLNYIHNPEDAQANFDLGLEYDLMGQTGAAISFYLRTAERSRTDVQQYEALLRMALCFERQKTRDDSEKVLLQKAIALMVNRPEAYFLLSRLHEKQQQWHDSYTVACQGLQVCDFMLPGLPTNVQYPGIYGLLFQKGVASWWVGLTEESREIMYDLKTNYDLDDMHLTAVNNNLNSCGYPKNMAPSSTGLGRYLHTPYDSSMRDRIRLSFPGLETIEKNHSQSYQDLFVLAATKGVRNGQYLEIGSAEPFKGNNTALLETKFNWRGLSIDINPKTVEEFKVQRDNMVICADATTVDYARVLKESGFTREFDFDYLQVDCEPPETSFQILQRIPFDQYTFRVITFEHDYYCDQSVRDRSRDYLRSQGYELLVSDVAYNRLHSYEDWWVHPDFVDETTRDQLRDIGTDLKFATDYMFPVVKENKTEVTADTSLFNADAMPGFWVVDNFYTDPDAIREFALKQRYQTNHDGEQGYIGTRTEQQFLFPGLKERFEQIMGRPITRWHEHGMNGRFQYCKAGDPLVYHCDLQAWAGMLYLTPDAPYNTGTSTYALKGTDIRHLSHPDIYSCFKAGSRNFDRTPFETVDVLGNVYNRLVIFNAGYLHAASEYFGFTAENSRLWQMFFFD